MDFFDNALDKAKEALEIVSQKTEEVVAAGKQKFTIASLENQQGKLFKALGEIYYNNIKDTQIDDEQIKSLVDDISKKQADIELLKTETQSAK